jgi:hypothetical protein
MPLSVKGSAGLQVGMGREANCILSFPSSLREVVMGREANCILSFPLSLREVFIVPGIVVGTIGSVDCVYCVGGACCKVSSF